MVVFSSNRQPVTLLGNPIRHGSSQQSVREKARYAALVEFSASHPNNNDARKLRVGNPFRRPHTLSTQGPSCVTVVGHSLGGALALLDGVFFTTAARECEG